MAEPDYESPLHVLAVERPGRQPGDDFFCLRYSVWYPSFDCAIRTRFRTSVGCLACEQGRFNLKRHRQALHRVRFPLPPVESAT